ncbi:hypothetical protein F511_10999 [Dorcoceras hygrometricum]|uniref:Uncharacterized protein n=1 Tax=Dorcoceras hygrometricum TaxID=472368 RepID=A0A2Z7CQI6_9LAMI|nr:hypothetical protein F511_10999 [Dorcoceras hygrometricum]
MEEEGQGGGVVAGVEQYWWWAAASAAQLGWGIYAFRKGHAGDSRLMPFKAFTVASLFVGASACAAVASLRASGIHSVRTLLGLSFDYYVGGSRFGLMFTLL